MKNAIILHSSSETPASYWYPSVSKFLETRGYKVWIPQLPAADAPNLKIQLPFVLKNGVFNEKTIIIGHSISCPLLLSILENINTKISKAIFVAGYARKLQKMKSASLKKAEESTYAILQKRYDWNKIKKNVKDIIIINSDNDPWGCDDKEGEYMFRNLGGTFIIPHGEGHMGSRTFKQPYKKFTLLEKLLLL